MFVPPLASSDATEPDTIMPDICSKPRAILCGMER